MNPPGFHAPGALPARRRVRDAGREGPVEKFTILVVSLGAGGEIRFDWDKIRWILPFTVR
jgi:hypothetical protein